MSGSQQSSARSTRTAAAGWLRTIAPRGWRHLLFQVALLGSFEVIYALSGIYGRRANGAAVANAHGLLRLEGTLRIDWEHGLQEWVLRAPHVFLEIANRTYFVSQFTVSIVFLLWVYARRHEHYARVRNALLAANYVSVIVMFVYPLAPPRAIPGAGFADTLDANAVNLHTSLISALNNPNSAMPSLHASYAIVVGITGFLLTRNPVTRACWAIYPLLVTYSVIATGNHYVLDVVAGVAALAATPVVDRAARWLATRTTGRVAWLALERET